MQNLVVIYSNAAIANRRRKMNTDEGEGGGGGGGSGNRGKKYNPRADAHRDVGFVRLATRTREKPRRLESSEVFVNLAVLFSAFVVPLEGSFH